ncbi:endonuclease domain-containing protein [Bacillus salipaludis]|uniref:DUF559 domain-containing protein n=1 Tax=Bacillus salipaludis TaxID=2547811 RepID=A0AA90TQG6_9BACI|nr:DUF559 domain-containing protein [Bacillus salipaludis]MDQ6598081.1 DUF559 domain-containing protein [Bacillus salipaludis]
MEKVCVVCGVPFKNKYKKVKTCGYDCGNELKKRKNEIKRAASIPEGVIDRRPASKKWDTPVIKSCCICGQKFAIPKSLQHRYSTCSDECTSQRHSKLHKKYESIKKKCQWCGKEFYPKPGVVAEKRLFCSDDCRLEALNASNRQHRPPRTGTCIICSTPYRKKRPTQKWCSRECMWKDENYISRRSLSLAELAKGKKPTKIEKWLYEALEEGELNFKKYVPIGAYIVDALLIDYNMIVEVDGRYWHEKKAEHDKLRDIILSKKGYTTVRFSDVVLKNKKKSIQIILESIKEIISLQLNKKNVKEERPYKVFWSREIFKDFQ